MDLTNESPRAIELRRTADAVRQWSIALRAWAQQARARSRAIRGVGAVAPRNADGPRPNRGDDEVSLGVIRVSELFTILVDHHDLSAREAAAALVVQLDRAGYPTEAAFVSGVDGFDMVQAALEARS
jgi:hypothetical protein